MKIPQARTEPYLARCPREEKQLLVAFGGNFPFGETPPKQVMQDAIGCLAEKGLEIRAISRFFRTPAFPAGSGPDYVNGALAATLRHDRTPEAILQLLHEVEAAFGRQRHSRWAGRTLDLDLLAIGDSVMPDRAGFMDWLALPPEEQARRAPDRLILPHPRMQDRAFVLVPLADVAPDWHHPVLNRTVAQMLAALPPGALAEVRPIPENAAD